MIVLFGGLLAILYTAGVCEAQSVHDVQWLPCQFRDETVEINEDGHKETKFHMRNAELQFGNQGSSPINPNAITFLVTVSKVDIRQYVEGGEDTVECEIHRYSTGGIVMRWPGLGAQDHDVWFTALLRHSQGHFALTAFLRHTPVQTSDQEFIKIGDREILTTAATLMLFSRTPNVHVGLMKEQTLHCQFFVDHKHPDVTVEWRSQKRGERTVLFSHSSRTGKNEGTGVSVKGLASGIASYKIPLTTHTNEGTYTCSVMVPPLYGSNDITLNIQEPPRVSVNVGTTLTLAPGGEQKIVCDAEGYYPLDVNIEWLREPAGSSLLPEVLKNVLYSSHRHLRDGTYSLSAFFILQPGIKDSETRYTCRVTHVSLRSPIRKSFILIIAEQDSVLWYVLVFGFIAVMILILVKLLPQFISAKRQAEHKRLW